MVLSVNKALDRKAVNFGLRGSYLQFAARRIGIAFLGAIVLSVIISFVLAAIAFGIAAVFIYLYVSGYQDRVSEKERDRILSSRRLPRRIQVRPVRFRQLMKANFGMAKDAASMTKR